MNKKILIITIALLMTALVTATVVLFLFPYDPQQPPKADAADSTPSGIQEVVTANNQFALDSYFQLSQSEPDNLFYSPYSISAALALVYEGAKGQTAEEIKSVFHFPESNILRPNFASIYNQINRGKNANELRTGNALWVQQNSPLLQDYTSRVEKYYGGKAANVNFIEETEKSRQTINSFIEEQTNGKIKDLISSGTLNKLTRLILTNAVYFKGTWEWEFDKSDTSQRIFMVTPTTPIKAMMMSMDNDKAKFNYFDTEDLQILELPYKGEEISMLIILPTKDLESIKPLLTLEKLEEYKSQMSERKLEKIIIPKFEFDTKYALNENLKALGMPTAFDKKKADFSGMTTAERLYIDFVVHQAYIKVDEEGTEAAAATATGMMKATSFDPRNHFVANHPFIFIIQERETGSILFMGRVTDPTK